MPKRKTDDFDTMGGLYVDLRKARPSKVPCDGCRKNVAKDPHAWVGWWVEHQHNADGSMKRRPVVHDFGVHCPACAERLPDGRTGPQGQELHRWDVNLDAWAGQWAIIQLREQLPRLRWPRKQLKRLLLFAVRASSLPTGRGPAQM